MIELDRALRAERAWPIESPKGTKIGRALPHKRIQHEPKRVPNPTRMSECEARPIEFPRTKMGRALPTRMSEAKE